MNDCPAPILARLPRPHLFASEFVDPSVAVAAPPPELMWMPGGQHEIQATRGGEPVRVRVVVDPGTATALQRSLRGHLAGSPHKPFFDFDHQGGPAAAWPVEFLWRDAPSAGVFARVEWSAAGRGAITGREYRAFSPTFLIDEGDPAHVTGAPLNMGGLVNDPAFRAIQPLWARRSPADAADPSPHLNPAAFTPMNEPSSPTPTPASHTNTAGPGGPTPPAAFSAAGNGSATPAPLPTPPGHPGAVAITAAAPVQLPMPATDHPAAQALRVENDRLQGELRAARTRDAQAAVQAAIARGALPPQDAALQAHWTRLLESDPTHASLLAALPGQPALQTIVPSGQAGSGGVAVLSADTRRVIQAYHSAPTPLDRGIIYARDISPRLKQGDELVLTAALALQGQPGTSGAPVQAANNLGTLVGALVTQRSLELLKFHFPMLSRITTDFSAEHANFNQTISTRIRAVPPVSTYDPVNGYTTANAVTTDISIAINTHNAVQISFNANELASTRRLLFGEQEEGMHYALGKSIVDALYALITAANFPLPAQKTVQALAGFGRPAVVSMARALSLRGVMTLNRSLLLYSDYFAQLAQDPALISLAAYQRPELITRYELPDVAGFRPIEAPNLPATGNLTGFAFTPDALCVATRVPNDYTQVFPGASGGGVTSIVTNPDTGFSVMLVEYINHQLGQAVMRVALMYGVALGQTASGQLLTSA
jgi:hypothetical protein